MKTIAAQSQSLVRRLVRSELLTLEPYQSARRIGGQGDIWVNANESPFNNTDIANINRYPQCQPPLLIDAYSRYADVATDNIICTRGADEAIELLIRTFCTAGKDSIACFGPTYGMYTISALTANIGVNRLELTENYQLPFNYHTQITTEKIIFLCNPNNPTGTLLSREQIELILQVYPQKLIVVDEAYIEFCTEHTVTTMLKQCPNLVVLRTLSKAFALAGARCGFLLANIGIIDMIMRVIAPYPIPEPVAQIAINALSKDGINKMKTQVAKLKQQGQQLIQLLNQSAETVLETHGNFVLAFYNDPTDVWQKLHKAGIVARSYKDKRIENAIRFSFSDQQDTDKIIQALSR